MQSGQMHISGLCSDLERGGITNRIWYRYLAQLFGIVSAYTPANILTFPTRGMVVRNRIASALSDICSVRYFHDAACGNALCIMTVTKSVIMTSLLRMQPCEWWLPHV